MPNGGSDCCAFCGYNLAVQRLGVLPFSSRRASDLWKAEARVLLRCTLRDVSVPSFMHTYCANFTRGRAGGDPPHARAPKGPAYALGPTEKNVTYPRIPWHHGHEPLFGDFPGQCFICQREIEGGRGVAVSAERGATLKFCCSSHYMQWWFQVHPGERLRYRYDQLSVPGSTA